MEKVAERPDMQNEVLLTPEDMVEIFNVDVSTIEGWVSSKLLSATFVTPHSDTRFTIENICRFIAKHEKIWLPYFKLENEVLAV